jgi:hypothetical protein
MEANSKTISKCQISGARDLRSIMFLGYFPPPTVMKKIGSKTNEEKLYPADLVYSPTSKLVQINNIVKKEILFPKSYAYTSSTTKILRKNFQELYQECRKLIKISEHDLVIDIGSNDGNLLNNFKDNHKVLGITPEKVGLLAIKKGIPTLIRYFDKTTAKLVKKKYGKAKIITATNVFAHIEDVNSLMKNIIQVLEKDGVFISESHYLVSLIRTNQYDTIYHEHLRFYSLTSLKYLFDKYGLTIFHAKKIGTHGGSIRVYVTKNKKIKINKNVNKILKTEKKYLNWKTFNKFKKNVIQSKMNLYSLLKKIKKNKKKICGIGAPVRATTLVNFVGLDENIIDYIVEVDGSKKIGNYMPGTKIQIVSEKKLFTDKPDYALMFSWHIAKELKAKLKKRGFKGKFVVPLPQPKII